MPWICEFCAGDTDSDVVDGKKSGYILCARCRTMEAWIKVDGWWTKDVPTEEGEYKVAFEHADTTETIDYLPKNGRKCVVRKGSGVLWSTKTIKWWWSHSTNLPKPPKEG